jgi:hypothetical protein
MGVHCMCAHWGTLTNQHVFGFVHRLAAETLNIQPEHARMWIERNFRVGPLVLLDASPFRTMV